MKHIPPTTPLDAFLASITTPEPQQPDEFTAREALTSMRQRNISVTLDAVRFRLARGVDLGTYSVRKVLIDGKHTSVYRLKTPGIPPTPTPRPSACDPSKPKTRATVRPGKRTRAS